MWKDLPHSGGYHHLGGYLLFYNNADWANYELISQGAVFLSALCIGWCLQVPALSSHPEFPLRWRKGGEKHLRSLTMLYWLYFIRVQYRYWLTNTRWNEIPCICMYKMYEQMYVHTHMNINFKKVVPFGVKMLLPRTTDYQKPQCRAWQTSLLVSD